MANISYRIESISVNTLLEGLQDGHIKRWDDLEVGSSVIQTERTSYITSVMAGIPLLPLVFDGTKSPWTLLDGEKRFSLLWGFANNRFALMDSMYYRIPVPKFYRDLPMFMKRKFCSTKIPCIVLNPPLPENVIEDIKNRIKKPLD